MMPTDEEMEWVGIASDTEDAESRLFRCLACGTDITKTYAMYHFATIHAGMGEDMLKRVRKWIVVTQGVHSSSHMQFLFVAHSIELAVHAPGEGWQRNP